MRLKVHRLLIVLIVPLLSLGIDVSRAEDLEEQLFNYQLFLAEKGNPKFQYDVGVRYEEGHGVAPDRSKALEWYRKAAEQGHTQAQERLTRLTETKPQGTGPVDKPPRSTPAETATRAAKPATVATATTAVAAAESAPEPAASSVPSGSSASKPTTRKTTQAPRPEPTAPKKPAPAAASAAAPPKRPAAAAAPPPKPAVKPVIKPQPRAGSQTRAPNPRPAPQPTAPTRVAKAPTPPPVPKPRFDDPTQAAAFVAGHKWHFFDQPADYLPSEQTRCLKAGDVELVCFSREGNRRIGDDRVTYSAKAVIDRFDRSGAFTVSYVYNVTDVDAAESGDAGADPHGLTLAKGWQEPGHELRCRLSGQTDLLCQGPNGADLVFQAR